MALKQVQSEDEKLQTLVEDALQDAENNIIISFKVSESQPGWIGRPRVLSITCKRSLTTQKLNVLLYVFKYISNGLKASTLYKMEHLAKVEVVPSDISGCTLVLAFDNMKITNVAPPQWIMRNVADRNRFLTTVIRLCKENFASIPKIIGTDVVEMAMWEQAHMGTAAGDGDGQTVHKITVEKELVYKAEEDDMETLLDRYVMGIDETEAFSERLERELFALEAANVHEILESDPVVEEVLKRLNNASDAVEDMGEWLGVLDLKLKHMREDIESIESRNTMLETQVQNNAALVLELNGLVERLRVPQEYATRLISGPFDESRVSGIVEACEWLAGAIRGLEPPLLDPAYTNMRAVNDKLGELAELKATFVKRASELLINYFTELVEVMINDENYLSKRGELRRPDHAELRFKCRTYARLLQQLKSLDKNSLGPLRKAYCHSLNLLLRRECREFVKELRASTKVLRTPNATAVELAGSSGGAGETSNVSDAYGKMLQTFIPLVVDESAFFASFLCYEVFPLAPPGGLPGDEKSEELNEPKPSEQNVAELEALNQALQELPDGIQEDFYAAVDWAYKVDPVRCITLQEMTEKYLSSHRADAAGFVQRLLADLRVRIGNHFNKFIDEICNQIEKHDRSMKQTGVLSYISRFSALATRMEGLVQGKDGKNDGMCREMADLAYTKLVGTMFSVLERIAQNDPKYADVVLLENYAAFQNSMFDLANAIPVLARFYHQASEAYEQACTRYVNSIINTQFEKLFQFSQRVEVLLYTITPEEVPFQLGLSKNDLRKVLKASLSSGAEKSLQAMYKRIQKNLTSEELLPNLWHKCKDDFLEKYEALEAMIKDCYPTETLSPSSKEMKELFEGV